MRRPIANLKLNSDDLLILAIVLHDYVPARFAQDDQKGRFNRLTQTINHALDKVRLKEQQRG